MTAIQELLWTFRSVQPRMILKDNLLSRQAGSVFSLQRLSRDAVVTSLANNSQERLVRPLVDRLEGIVTAEAKDQLQSSYSEIFKKVKWKWPEWCIRTLAILSNFPRVLIHLISSLYREIAEMDQFVLRWACNVYLYPVPNVCNCKIIRCHLMFKSRHWFYWNFQIPLYEHKNRDGPTFSDLAVLVSTTNNLHPAFPRDVLQMLSSSALVFLLLHISGMVILTYCNTWIHHNFLQITLAALVYTIPLLLLIETAGLRRLFLFMDGCIIWMSLDRIFGLARSLEKGMQWRQMVKSDSEIELTRIEIWDWLIVKFMSYRAYWILSVVKYHPNQIFSIIKQIVSYCH